MKVREAWIFAAGLLLAAAVAIGAYVAWRPAPPPQAALAVFHPPAPAQPVLQPAVASTPPKCDFEPLVAQGARGDGQFSLQAALQLNRSADAAPFVTVADEAQQDGRPRDAEVALIAACRLAAQGGAFSAPLGDVQGRLAQHYVLLAQAEADAPRRAALLQRAQVVMADVVQAYTASLGEQASKTRLAHERLAALRDAPSDPAALRAPLMVRAPKPPPTATLGAARQSLARRGPAASEDLRQADQDLQRLYAQASAVARDRAGLQRRQQEALAARAACPDDACLRQWYAQRRQQLFAEF